MTPNNNIPTVIFDFDGTLADSFTSVMAIAYRLTKREQLADIEYIKQMRDGGVGLKQAIKVLKVPRWHLPWLLTRGRRLMTHEIDKIPLFDGMGEVIAELNKENYQLYIITTNSRANVMHLLRKYELNQYFKQIYGGAGFFDKSKLIKRVIRDQKLKNGSIIYIGDEVRDIQAAKELNLACIAVSWGYNSENLLEECRPTALVNDPKQLAAEIAHWNKTL